MKRWFLLIVLVCVVPVGIAMVALGSYRATAWQAPMRTPYFNQVTAPAPMRPVNVPQSQTLPQPNSAYPAPFGVTLEVKPASSQASGEQRALASLASRETSEERRTKLIEKLRASVAKEWEERSNARSKELEAIKNRLETAQKQHDLRVSKSKEIIDRRVNDLLGRTDVLDWNANASTPASPYNAPSYQPSPNTNAPLAVDLGLPTLPGTLPVSSLELDSGSTGMPLPSDSGETYYPASQPLAPSIPGDPAPGIGVPTFPSASTGPAMPGISIPVASAPVQPVADTGIAPPERNSLPPRADNRREDLLLSEFAGRLSTDPSATKAQYDTQFASCLREAIDTAAELDSLSDAEAVTSSQVRDLRKAIAKIGISAIHLNTALNGVLQVYRLQEIALTDDLTAAKDKLEIVKAMRDAGRASPTEFLEAEAQVRKVNQQIRTLEMQRNNLQDSNKQFEELKLKIMSDMGEFLPKVQAAPSINASM